VCGITGFWGFRHSKDPETIIKKMNDQLRHRGPDASGYWQDANQSLFLGHRRLSIIDTSENGVQPMMSHNARYVITFNGEIYNFKDIKKEIEISKGISSWKSGSDTEVLLELISAYGFETALTKIEGMFAFAVYDRHEKTLSFARDRMGEKPLYIWNGPTGIAFASELKALLKHPEFKTDINLMSVHDYLNSGYISGEASIFKNVIRLKPGHYMTLGSPEIKHTSKPYWKLSENDPSENKVRDVDEISDEIDALLKGIVKRQMISDVPIGGFLSGGIDSSLIVAIMQSLSSQNVNTYSIGFDNDAFNEAHHAKRVANHLGVNHTEMYFDETQLRDYIPKLSQIYCEPFSDSSQLPTLLVSELARKHVTVALSGDGADELFCGYSHYARLSELREKYQNNVTKAALKYLGKPVSDIGLSILPFNSKLRSLNRLSRAAQTDYANDFYHQFTAFWNDRPPLVNVLNHTTHKSSHTPLNFSDNRDMFCRKDINGYLTDDILVKVDRASMHHSLEVRAPFLNHNLVEYSQSLNIQNKFSNNVGKLPLRNLLYRYVPREIVDRPKKGFSVPLSQWLRGPLRDWAHDILHPDQINSHGILDAKRVENCLKAHDGGQDNLKAELWSLIMFQSWYDSVFK